MHLLLFSASTAARRRSIPVRLWTVAVQKSSRRVAAWPHRRDPRARCGRAAAEGERDLRKSDVLAHNRVAALRPSTASDMKAIVL
eukprot:2484309-Prymnesium_polylepis.1